MGRKEMKKSHQTFIVAGAARERERERTARFLPRIQLRETQLSAGTPNLSTDDALVPLQRYKDTRKNKSQVVVVTVEE